MKPDDPQAHIRLFLRKRRRALGATQEQFAKALGLSRLSYHRIETGPRKIEIDLIKPMMSVLSCSLDELLGADLAASYRAVSIPTYGAGAST